MTARILLTGGAGFIGSHTYVALCEAGYECVILDNFSNSFPDVPRRLEWITGQPANLIRADVRDGSTLDKVMRTYRFDAVIHLAALKSVPLSLAYPGAFIRANVAGLCSLVAAMERNGVNRLVHSSSATVYGKPEALPIPEHAPLSFTNPYGLTKLWAEQFLSAQAQRQDDWAIGVLRYFNPAGADASGLIGEAPRGDGGNLFPLLAQVAAGKRPYLPIFGGDYGTPDGTGIRDFIHVCDLAEGHVLSLERLLHQGKTHTVNLGSGRGHSVLEMVKAYEVASGHSIPYRIDSRRAGDVAASYADPAMARAVLGFRTQRDLGEMCASSWLWEDGQKSRVAARANRRIPAHAKRATQQSRMIRWG